MDDTEVYLRPEALIEPLFNRWYAWSYLIAPAPAAMLVQSSHVRLMQSFVAAPQIHARALEDPALRGGPFLDLPPERAPEVRRLLERTLATQARRLAFADAVKALDRTLADEARGGSMEALYTRIPEPLRGYVELHYDLKDSPSIRFIEPLLYRSRLHDPASQAVCLSLRDPDARRFALSTPRLDEPGDTLLELPFASPALDALYKARRTKTSFGRLREALRVAPEGADRLAAFFTTEAPEPAPAGPLAGVRVRYFGHASVLVEAPGVSVLFDPAVSLRGGPDRAALADLPETIDYVVITHGHQDHVLLESLLELRHRVRTVVVPRSAGDGLIDPSLRLIFESLGFRDVRELAELETLPLPGGSLLGVPFLGEHGDLPIRSKLAYRLELGGRRILMLCDSNNLDPELYEHVHGATGDADVIFVGMDCDGAPMSWLYGPLFTRPLLRKNDQARRFDGSDCEKASRIVDVFHPRQVCVYAMGQEPWLRHVRNVVYTPESRPIVESDRLVERCRERGISAERLHMKMELQMGRVC